jgi:type II secretory pathway pseudopilin PulG
MMQTAHRPFTARREAGFTLIEMMLTMGLTLIIMASTLGAMNNAIRAGEVATLTTNMNQGLRTAMDIIVRDMLQVGQGLPSGRTIDIPNGNGSAAIRLPAGPNVANTTPRTMPQTWDSATSAWKAAEEMTAIIPGPGQGSRVNNIATNVLTDTITMVQADGAFLSTISDYDVNLTALDATRMIVDPSVDISNGGADDLHVGDLIMLQKATSTALVQITRAPTSTDTGTAAQTVYFDVNDSLLLNQTAGANGTLTRHVATAPLEVVAASGFVPSTATRVRLISYYIDSTTDPNRPRLVRRINNGSATSYDNRLGTAVAFDVENMQITYDLVDGVNNPSGVKMNATDLSGAAGGACAPFPCSPNQIRKINITISGRSRTPLRTTNQYFRNSLTTQVSLRSMSFIDRYR